MCHRFGLLAVFYIFCSLEYGSPDENELQTQVKVIKESLIEIQLCYVDRIIKKKLPPSIPVQKLITLVQKLFRLDGRPDLVYVSNSQSNIEIELTDECKELEYYSVEAGDKIIIRL